MPASPSKKTEEEELPVHESQVIDLYKEPEDLLEKPTLFNRKRRYELVQPSMT